MKRYVVINVIDNEEMKTFKTKKEAQQFIKECKIFDKEMRNPFKEEYRIEVETE